MKTLQNFLEEQFNDGMMLAVLSGQRNKDKDIPTKVRIRPIEIKGEICYQATATVGTKAVHKNYTADEGDKSFDHRFADDQTQRPKGWLLIFANTFQKSFQHKFLSLPLGRISFIFRVVLLF